jgi:ComEC/Rec2-related protein
MPLLLFVSNLTMILLSDFIPGMSFWVPGIVFAVSLFLLMVYGRVKGTENLLQKVLPLFLLLVLTASLFLGLHLNQQRSRYPFFKWFKGEVKEVRYREKGMSLVMSRGDYKVWGGFKHQFKVRPGNTVYVKGQFYPVWRKNYFYSEHFTHTGRIKFLKVLDKKEVKEPVTGVFKDFFRNSLYASLYQGFILGKRQNIPEPVLKLFKANGCMHLLAISGLHVGIIAVLIFFILKLLPVLPKHQIFLSIAVLGGYLFLIDFPPSATRAIVFTGLLGAAKMLERRVSLLDVLYLTGFFILLFQPRIIYSLGFQLSFLATFGILFLLPLAVKITDKIRLKPLKFLANGLFIGFSAQIFIFPLILYHFQVFNWISLFLTIPLSILLTGVLYWALIGMGISVLWPGVGKMLLHGGDFMNWTMIELMKWGENIRFLTLETGISIPAMAGFYAVLLGMMLWVKRKWKTGEIVV